MPLILRNEKGAPLTNAEVDGNFTYLKGRADTTDQAAATAQNTANSASAAASTAQQTAEAAGTAAQQAQKTADEAGLAAEQANTDLAAHKTSGDHDDRYLKLDEVVTAPAVGKTPKAGEAGTISQAWVEGLVNELKYLRAVAENVDWSSPMPLWADGRDGFWYDIQDSDTLFADLVGTPAVLNGPVALVLDKHLGGVTIDENPAAKLTTGLDGWAAGSATTAEWKDGAAEITFGGSTGSQNNWFALAVPSNQSKLYEVEFDAEWVSGTRLMAGVTYTNALNIDPTPAGEVHRYRFRLFKDQTYSQDTSRCVAFGGTAVGNKWRISNIEVRSIPGHHAYQATSTARAVLQQYPAKRAANGLPAIGDSAWILGAGWSASGGKLIRASTTTGAVARAAYAMVPGRSYYYRIVVDSLTDAITGTGIRLAGGASVRSPDIRAPGTYIGILTAVEGSNEVQFATPAGETAASISAFEFGEILETRNYLQPDGVDDSHSIGQPLDLNTGLVGFAMENNLNLTGGLKAILSGSNASGYLLRNPVDGSWGRYNSGTRLPAKNRQSVIFSPEVGVNSTSIEDSTGQSAVAAGHSLNGLSTSLFLNSFRGTGGYAAYPFYGAIACVGPSTETERRQVMRLLDNYLGEVSE